MATPSSEEMGAQVGNSDVADSGDDALREHHAGPKSRGGPPSNLVAWFEYGQHLLDEREFGRAAIYLRRAHGWWASLGDAAPYHHDSVLAEYHWGLLELWREEQDPRVAVEAWPLEAVALRHMREGSANDSTPFVLYNAACLRAMMSRSGMLDPVEGMRAIDLLNLVFDSAGGDSGRFAENILTDPDLDGLRQLPSFRRLAARASAFLTQLRKAKAAESAK